MECQICNGEMHPFGVLGNAQWYICKQCGMMHWVEIEED